MKRILIAIPLIFFSASLFSMHHGLGTDRELSQAEIRRLQIKILVLETTFSVAWNGAGRGAVGPGQDAQYLASGDAARDAASAASNLAVGARAWSIAWTIASTLSGAAAWAPPSNAAAWAASWAAVGDDGTPMSVARASWMVTLAHRDIFGPAIVREVRLPTINEAQIRRAILRLLDVDSLRFLRAHPAVQVGYMLYLFEIFEDAGMLHVPSFGRFVNIYGRNISQEWTVQQRHFRTRHPLEDGNHIQEATPTEIMLSLLNRPIRPLATSRGCRRSDMGRSVE